VRHAAHGERRRYNPPVRWLWLAGLLGCGRIGFGLPADGAGEHAGNGDSGAPSDALDAPGTASVCPTTALLADDFQDGVTGPQWTVLTATDLTVSETAGVLRVAYAAMSGPTEIAGYRQAAAADYTTSCVIAEINSVPNASAAYMDTRVGTGPSDYVGFTIGSGMMSSSLHNGASVMTADVRAFDPVAHRFLRLRMSPTGTVFEASPDDITYSQLGAVTGVFGLATSTQLDLIATTTSQAQNAGNAEWASIRVLVP
jgi:hypothetical protein